MKKGNITLLLGTIIFSLCFTSCTNTDKHNYYTIGQQMNYIGNGSEILANAPMFYTSFNKKTSSFVFKQKLDYKSDYIYQLYLPKYTTKASYNETDWQKNDDFLMQFKFEDDKTTIFNVKFSLSIDFFTKYDPLYVYPMAEKTESSDKMKQLIRLSLYFKGIDNNEN